MIASLLQLSLFYITFHSHLFNLNSYYCSAIESESLQPKKKKKIAIIGGGISGTFTAKYLSDYDDNCLLDSITLYEPYSIISTYKNSDEEGHKEALDAEDDNLVSKKSGHSLVIPQPLQSNKQEEQLLQQGSRVSSIKLSNHNGDETIVELGASIIFSGNKLAVEMLEHDDSLVKVKPLSSESSSKCPEDNTENKMNEGLGIFDGHPKNVDGDVITSWPLLTSNMTKEETKQMLLWRYNLDLYKVNKATDEALESFSSIYDILKSNHISSFDYESPNDIWEKVGLRYAASVSLDKLLDDIGVSNYISWWRRWFLSNQGLLRDEFLTAMNICNNNKDNTQMTGKYGRIATSVFFFSFPLFIFLDLYLFPFFCL